MPAMDAQEDTRQEVLDAVKAKYGFVPNLIREMSKSPAAAWAYVRGQDAMADASLSLQEQQVVQLAVAVYNECSYCKAAHRTIGRRAGVAPPELESIEKGNLPEDSRLRSLVSATWQILDAKGWLGPPELATLESEGIGRGQLYELVALIGLKTISNYVNHIAHTPIDAAFGE